MFNLIKRDLISLWRDKGALFFIVLFPAMMVFLLGNLLQNMDTSDAAIEPIKMAYTVETTDAFGLQAIESFTEALGGHAAVQLVKTDDIKAAEGQVDNGELAAALRFTQPFGVEIYEGFDTIQNRAINSIFQGFSRQVASISVLATAAPEKLAEAANAAVGELVQQKHFGYSRSMLDYYAVVMCVMIVFMGSSIGGASNLYDGRRDGTLRRQMISPKNRANMYIQGVVGTLPQSVIQVLSLMLVSTLVFGARYANTWQDNLLLFAMMVLGGMAANATGMLVGMLLPVNPMLVIMPLLWVLMFVSGTFSKEIYIEGLTERSPVWLIQNAAFDLTVFGRGEKCLEVLLVCAVVLALATAAGALLFRRKGLVAK